MKIIECPRDAMQGLTDLIPTEQKALYINKLLQCGFDTIDFGSFVSAKAIPQLADTSLVLDLLDLNATSSKLLAIVANTRGAEDAAKYSAIDYLGFPLSISETFQKRNTNKSIAEALNAVEEIQNVCLRSNKKLVAYISMGFGNPYNDPYSPDLVGEFAGILATLGASVISLADTIGVSEPGNIKYLFNTLTAKYPSVEFGAHLHSNSQTAYEKVEAAFNAGCRRFDGAIRGFGGCPMADDSLVGNISTETIVSLCDNRGVDSGIDMKSFAEAQAIADKIFPNVSH